MGKFYIQKSMRPGEVGLSLPLDFDGVAVVPANLLGKLPVPTKAESFNDAFKRLMHPEQVQQVQKAATVHKAANSALLRIQTGRWG